MFALGFRCHHPLIISGLVVASLNPFGVIGVLPWVRKEISASLLQRSRERYLGASAFRCFDCFAWINASRINASRVRGSLW